MWGIPNAVDSDHDLGRLRQQLLAALFRRWGRPHPRRHFGEGNCEESERIIQRLLKEAGKPVGNDMVSVDPRGFEVQADWATPNHRRTTSARRTENFAFRAGAERGAAPTAPAEPRRKISGHWQVSDHRTRGRSAPAGQGADRIPLHARDLHQDGPLARGTSIRFRAYHGQPRRAHGATWMSRVWHGDRAATISLHPPTQVHRGPVVRNRVHRRRRRGVRLHLG